MKQMLKAIKKIKDEFVAKNAKNGLYDACNNSLHPWGNYQNLANKLRIIGAACGGGLEKGFSKTVAGKGVVESYSFKGNVDELYLYAAKYLLDNAQDDLQPIATVNFNYNWDEVTSSVKNAVGYTLQLNNLITEAARKYNLNYVDNFDEDTRLPSYIQLSGAILHYHFPQSAFLYNRKLRQKASKLFLVTEECKLDDIIVPNGVKEDLFSRYVNVANYLRDTFVPQYDANTSFWTMNYVNYCAYVYVLGCFVKERLTVDCNVNMFALVNEVVNYVI